MLIARPERVPPTEVARPLLPTPHTDESALIPGEPL
jgi:hypothetical protein